MLKKEFTTIDLFCGAGGITEGFRQAGYNCLYATDINPWAIKTFQLNHESAIADIADIEELDPSVLRKRLNVKQNTLSVLVGGPPCQGFSVIAPDRFLEDPRNSLFRHYIRFIDEFRPQSLLLENVPGMLSLSDGKVYKQIIFELEKMGYITTTKILFAPHYGVPQERWRLIILGTNKLLPLQHPQPIYYAEGIANFTGGKDLIFKLNGDRSLPKAPTVRDAIGDLPRIKTGEGKEVMSYGREAKSDFALAMRGRQKVIFNHVAPKLSEINLQRMKYIKPGGSWRDLPVELLPKGMKRARRSDHTKRYGRLTFNGLSGTILTKVDPHWGAVILPDQDRTLTVREAARLQSFPDHYKFVGPRVSQYEQVGNAVPVLLAKAIAIEIKKYLDKNA